MEKTKLAIVVTAFFPIPSKAPTSFYLEVARTFLKNCPANIIIFTTSLYTSIFKEMIEPSRDITVYEEKVDEFGLPIECPVKGWLSLNDWTRSAEIMNIRNPWHNKGISIQLLILWLSKAWFVKKAILNIKEDKPIFWHDIGSVRSKEDIVRLRKWPAVCKLGDLNDNKIRFFKRKILPNTYCYDCDADSFIAGSHIFGNKKAWELIMFDIKNAVLDNINKYNDGLCDETIYLKLVMDLPERYLALGGPTNYSKGWYQTFETHGDNRLVFDVAYGNSLIIYPSHEGTNQLFKLIYTENKEYFSLKSESNNLVISENKSVCFEEYDGRDAQLFTFVKTSEEYGYLENKSKKVLDVYDFGRDSTRILLWQLNGGNNQLFRFNKISDNTYQIQVNYS